MREGWRRKKERERADEKRERGTEQKDTTGSRAREREGGRENEHKNKLSKNKAACAMTAGSTYRESNSPLV